LLPEKSSNTMGEIGFGLVCWAILLNGTFSFVCDIDETILKKKQQKIINFIAFIFFDIKNTYLTYEKQETYEK